MFLVGKISVIKLSELSGFLKVCQSLFRLFRLFKLTSQFLLQQIYGEKCPSGIRWWDLNPQPSPHESHTITTKPGLVFVFR